MLCCGLACMAPLIFQPSGKKTFNLAWSPVWLLGTGTNEKDAKCHGSALRGLARDIRVESASPLAKHSSHAHGTQPTAATFPNCRRTPRRQKKKRFRRRVAKGPEADRSSFGRVVDAPRPLSYRPPARSEVHLERNIHSVTCE